MTVAAVKPYAFPARDTVDKFPAPLLYIGWEDHLMFGAPLCLPLPASMPFGTMVEKVLPDLFGEHPDFARIDWSKVEWFKSGRPLHPDPAKSLADNGIGHKDVIRLRTPGLAGIGGSCS
ncbi:MAG: phenol hydroxylase subunit P4 [Thiomonas sp.]|uniref:phenol hydroxylase subunit P4 n=1 Tax=Thiomonas sp. TaxID=2047785 RepID=UPI002A372595|nr:phenol hydroxylase subunit P4 [Thiomonas sp.]MDY0329158.1 phenol hydroxylase subunit P4 [Thiomonas sp.]